MSQETELQERLREKSSRAINTWLKSLFNDQAQLPDHLLKQLFACVTGHRIARTLIN